MPSNLSPRIKKVAIVGGGAAGMSAAYALSLHPDLFQATLFERSSHPGGMATSHHFSPSQSKYFNGAEYINDGVQGASPTFYNTYAMFDILGFKPSEVGMQCSFGRESGEEGDFWSNVFPSGVIDRFQPDIQKFGKVLKIIKTLEPFFALMSVRTMLKFFRFSQDFGDIIVYPLVALFFGTGNQTPYVSCAILERVFMDPNMRLFEYSPKSFLASIPSMRAFPCLSKLFEAWADKITESSHGNVKICTNREVMRVQRHHSKSNSSKAVKLWSRKTKGTNNEQQVIEVEGEEEMEEFDELIIATDADCALKILGKDANWKERKVLGNVKYLWDLTVTHNDVDYMRKYYRLEYDPSLASPRTKPTSPQSTDGTQVDTTERPHNSHEDDAEAQRQTKFAENNFKPLYFIRSYPSAKSKVEMSFDLSNYQPQFKGIPPTGPFFPTSDSVTQTSPPSDLGSHIFQTIFLDHSSCSDLWTEAEIDPDKIVLRKWWKQQSHAVSHYRGTVPWMWAINNGAGKGTCTQFAGAWTVLNMHEIAVVSGFAAAYNLGASYPFTDSQDCKRLFALYLGLCHMRRMRKENRKGWFS